ncbi:hypothetical protein PSTT_13583, partial [Puccinia striiformis]
NAVGDGILQGTVKTSATFYEVSASVSPNAVLDALVTFGPNLTCYHIAIRLTDSSLDAELNSWNLSDDLGQIEYIFSDKMGTLTQKVMEFQRISIYGISYGEGVTEAMHRKTMLDFWKTLAICHDVILSRNDLAPN